jgi:hypothetical protein
MSAERLAEISESLKGELSSDGCDELDELLREVERLRESTSFPRPVTQDCLNPFEALLASGRDTITSSAIRAIVDTIRPRLLALEARADSAVTDHQQEK